MGGERELTSGKLHPTCPPGQTADVEFNVPTGMDALVLEFVHPDGRSIYTTRLMVDGTPPPAAPPSAFKAAPGAVPVVNSTDSAINVKLPDTTVTVDKATGQVTFALPGGGTMTGPTMNLGERRVDNGDQRRRGPNWIESKSAPLLTHPQVTSAASGDSATITVTVDVSLAEAPNDVLGRLTYSMEIHPDASADIAYKLDWTAPDANAWEFGVKFNLPTTYNHLGWYRDAQWTAYPSDYVGAVTGRVDAKDASFRATKRNAFWATMTDADGNGVALLRATTPLHVRGNVPSTSIELLASSAEYPPRSFSSGFLDSYQTKFKRGESKMGDFIIRPVRKSAVR
jgi:hypothetical protein